MNREDEILEAVLRLREATEMGFKSIEFRLDGHDARFVSLETRFDRFERQVHERFDAVDHRLDRPERHTSPP